MTYVNVEILRNPEDMTISLKYDCAACNHLNKHTVKVGQCSFICSKCQAKYIVKRYGVLKQVSGRHNKLRSTIPLTDIDEGARKQIDAALELPFLERLAIMPDVHCGYDLPIGSVALLNSHIWPGAIG